MKTNLAVQDQYPDEFAHCYGCGRLNEHGLRIKSFQQGAETICRFTPDPKYSGGFPGFLYGGMIASLMDCHGAATASAAQSKNGQLPPVRFVTASLKIDFRTPTPINTELEIKGRVSQLTGRKAVIELTLSASGKLCAEGSAVMVQMPGKGQDNTQ